MHIKTEGFTMGAPTFASVDADVDAIAKGASRAASLASGFVEGSHKTFCQKERETKRGNATTSAPSSDTSGTHCLDLGIGKKLHQLGKRDCPIGVLGHK